MFVWIKNTNHYVLTLSATSITLNSTAVALFQHVRYCMVGIDELHKSFAIRPVTKEEVDKCLVDASSLHKITIGKGYGRITSKSIMEQLSKLFQCDLDMLKIEARYDEKNQYLIADIRSFISEGMC